MDKEIISLHSVSKIIKGNTILKDISLTISSGEFVAIVGQSGAGKSTLLNILGCLDTPTTGKYVFNGITINNLSVDALSVIRNKYFGFVFQKYYLLNNLTVLENIELPAIYLGVSKEERKKRAKEILKNLGLKDKYANYPYELSGGQQQRVSIARALINDGKVIFADEPTGALDVKTGEAVVDILKRMHKLGYTVIIITHNEKIAAEACRVIEIQDGKILSDTRKSGNSSVIARKNSKEPINIHKNLKQVKIFFDSIKMSISSICYHKLRSFLTLLSIAIGIIAVICVLALGRSSHQKILEDIQNLGTNTLEIFPGKGFGDIESAKLNTLTLADVKNLSEISIIEAASPLLIDSGVLSHESISINSSLTGVNSDFYHIRGLKTVYGSFFSADDVKKIKSIVVIDSKAKKVLFKERDCINKIVFINGYPFKIVGVVKSLIDSTETPSVYMPYTSLIYKVSKKKLLDSIVLKVKKDVNIQAAEKNVTKLLLINHNQRKDFFIFNSDTIKTAIDKTSKTMNMLVASIALITVVIGGIGVMNIMLVSVSERTSEIGLKMAIGAQKKDVLQQFLIEAIVICSIGGIFGIVFSIFIIPIINMVIREFYMFYSYKDFVLSFFFSVFVGIVFGYLPAKKAANLSPKDALERD